MDTGRTDGHKKQVTTEGANTHPPPHLNCSTWGVLKSEKKLQKLTGQLRGRVRENANCAHNFGTAEEKQTELTYVQLAKLRDLKIQIKSITLKTQEKQKTTK